MNDQRGRAARSALWSLLENGGLSLISLATLVIYTRLLSAEQFGLFAVVLSLIEILQVVVTMFFHDALVQRKDASERHFDTAFTASLGASLLLSLGACLSAPLFAAAVDAPEAVRVLRWMTLCLPFAALSATIVARQRRSFGFRALAVRSLLGRVVGAMIGVGLIVAGAGVGGLIAQQVLIQAVGSAYLWKTCAERPRLRLGLVELRELSGFGVYAVGTLFLSFGIRRLFTIAAGMTLGVGVAGYLNLAFRTIDVFWAIAASAATQVALPLLSSLQSDLPRLRAAFQHATSLVCLLLYPAFIGIGLVAPELVELMFGAKWLASAPYVTALSCLVVLQAPRVLVAPLLTALGRPRDLVLAKAVELLFVAGSVAITRVPSLDIAVGIWLVRELVALPVTVRQLRAVAGLGVLEQFRGSAVPLLAALVMAAAVLGTKLLLPDGLHVATRLLVLVPVGVAAFVGSLLALDRRQLTGILQLAQAALRRGSAPALALGRSP
jgi:O-antigen/teichoic acid export membrane protein